MLTSPDSGLGGLVGGRRSAGAAPTDDEVTDDENDAFPRSSGVVPGGRTLDCEVSDG